MHPESRQITGDGDPIRLRVFIDRSVVEVFVNGKHIKYVVPEKTKKHEAGEL